MTTTILVGDVRDMLRTLATDSIHCCVTSPPYWGLRDYGVDGQIGLEASPSEFIATMVEVFEEVRRVLRPDGTCWINMGDSYANDGKWGGSTGGKHVKALHGDTLIGRAKKTTGLKPKDLCMMPHRLAIALQDAGWWVRQDIVWCLSGGAWVYARTQKGDMPVMVKDLVRLNPATVKLWNGDKWTQVLGWGESNDTSQRLEMVLRSGERIGCTGGHLWPTQRGNVAARDLVSGDVIETCTLPEPKTERPPYLTDGLLWLIGLYLAEGSRADDTVQLALCGDEMHWLPHIHMAAEQVGATMTYTVDGNCLNVRLYGRVLVAAIDQYIGGTTAIDKHMNNSAWALPNDALRMLISGYLAGDGHEDGNRIRLGFCRNYSLERDLRTAAARLGATITLNPCMAKYQNGTNPAFRGEWRWEKSGHSNQKDRGEIMEVRASRARKFWDIAVEDEPHLFSLSSGVLTHNCKPNPMPESVTDRCTKSHEYIFLLTKSAKYFYDAEAIREPVVGKPDERGVGFGHGTDADDRERGRVSARDTFKRENSKRAAVIPGQTVGTHRPDREDTVPDGFRNKRSIWTIATHSFPDAHFATFPPELPEICIKAGCPIGGTVLDPFFGAGTTGLVAERLQRDCIGIELNPAYAEMARKRIEADCPLLSEVRLVA